MEKLLWLHFSISNSTFSCFLWGLKFSFSELPHILYHSFIWNHCELNKGHLQNASFKNLFCALFFLLIFFRLLQLISSKSVLYFLEIGSMRATWWFLQKPHNGDLFIVGFEWISEFYCFLFSLETQGQFFFFLCPIKAK